MVFGLIIIVIVADVLIIVLYARWYTRVPPDMALVLPGKGPGGQTKVIKGGGVLVQPGMNASFLSLCLRSVEVTMSKVRTREPGWNLDMTVLAQLKISGQDSTLETASRTLIEKGDDEIRDMAARSLERHLRTLCADLTVADIAADKVKMAAGIQDSFVVDMNRIGLDVVSFVIKELHAQPDIAPGNEQPSTSYHHKEVNEDEDILNTIQPVFQQKRREFKNKEGDQK